MIASCKVHSISAKMQNKLNCSVVKEEWNSAFSLELMSSVIGFPLYVAGYN